MTYVALFLACMYLPLSAATAPPFPRLYNVEGGQSSSVHVFCGDGRKVLGGGCEAQSDPWIYGTSIPKADYWDCGWHSGNKKVRMTCVDSEYAPTIKIATGSEWAIASCDAGQKVIGGGCNSNGDNIYPWDMPEGNNAWKCGGNGNVNMQAVALCVDNSTETFIKEAIGGTTGLVQCDAGQQAVSCGCEVQSHSWKMMQNWNSDWKTCRCAGHGTQPKRVKAICVRTTTTTTTVAAYRYYRWTITKVHNFNIAFSEIELGFGNNKVTQPGVTAFALGARERDDAAEGALKAVDGDWNTKYYDNYVSPVVVDMQTPITADSFRWVTAEPHVVDDPTQWFFDGSADNVQWERLHSETHADTRTRNRNSPTPWMQFTTGQRTYRCWRFTVLKRNADDILQVAEVKFRKDGSEVSLSGVTVNSSQNHHLDHEASDILDNNHDSKFLVLHAANVQLTFDFGSNMALEEFGFIWGDDFPERDPKKWTMEGSTDGATWALLHQQLLPRNLHHELAARKTFVGWIPMRTLDSLPVIVLAQAKEACPFNFRHMTRDECGFAPVTAGQYLRGGGSNLDWHLSNTVDPKGCFTVEEIYFNSHPSGANGREYRHPLCKALPTTTTTSITTTTTITATATTTTTSITTTTTITATTKTTTTSITTTTTITATTTNTTTSITTTTTITATTTTTTTMLYSLINRATNTSFVPRANKVNDTCRSAGVWKISVISHGPPKVVTLEVYMLGTKSWHYLGHVGRGLLITNFGGPSFTWRLVSLGSDVYNVQNTVSTNFGGSYLVHNETGSHLASSAENEQAQWFVEDLP